jgi:hypothetical protein
VVPGAIRTKKLILWQFSLQKRDRVKVVQNMTPYGNSSEKDETGPSYPELLDEDGLGLVDTLEGTKGRFRQEKEEGQQLAFFQNTLKIELLCRDQTFAHSIL